MSNNEQLQTEKINPLAENEKKIVITGKDCMAALEYWEHFKIPKPPAFLKAVEAFEADPTYNNQLEVKYQVCKALVESDHESFKDEMFTKILAECRKVLYSMQFERDLDETLVNQAAVTAENKT